MGGPVWAIRLINQKQQLLVMVRMNIILSVGNEYVKLAWEFTGRWIIFLDEPTYLVKILVAKKKIARYST
jgi:hypothetical protein